MVLLTTTYIQIKATTTVLSCGAVYYAVQGWF